MMWHNAGLLTEERNTMADTIACYSSWLLSRSSLLFLEDEVALRACISFDPRDPRVMQSVLYSQGMLIMLST